MKLKMRLCYRVFLIALLFIGGLIIAAVIFPMLGSALPASVAGRRRDALKTAWLKCFGIIAGLHVTQEGDPLANPVLLVGNHVSWLDIIVLGRFLPASFIAKSDILNWPVIGYLARQGGTIFVRRGDKRQVQETAEKMLWLLRQGNAIIAFPEGTTTRGDDVLAFHASLFQPALLTRTAVQPVALRYLGEAAELAPFIGEDAFVPHLIRMLALDKIEVHVAFLPGINPTGKNRHAISYEARAMIVQSIDREAPELGFKRKIGQLIGTAC